MRNQRTPISEGTKRTFAIGQNVRYKPGYGVYGFEDTIEADGRIPGIVLGFTPTRVRIELTLTQRGGMKVRRSVEAASLQAGLMSGVTAAIGCPPSLLTDRARLQRCVSELGRAIAAGDVTPLCVELDVLATICDANRLPYEAARVRRWLAMGDPQ